MGGRPKPVSPSAARSGDSCTVYAKLGGATPIDSRLSGLMSGLRQRRRGSLLAHTSRIGKPVYSCVGGVTLLQHGRQPSQAPGLSRHLHPTHHTCHVGPPRTAGEDGPATRALRTPGPSLPSGLERLIRRNGRRSQPADERRQRRPPARAMRKTGEPRHLPVPARHGGLRLRDEDARRSAVT